MNENDDNGHKINNNIIITSKSSEYKTQLIGNTPNNNNVLGTEVVVPLKYLSIYSQLTVK